MRVWGGCNLASLCCLLFLCLFLVLASLSSHGTDDPWLTGGCVPRFVSIPKTAMQDKLAAQIKAGEADADGLCKKLVSLEMTAKNSQDHIDKMIRGGAARSS